MAVRGWILYQPHHNTQPLSRLQNHPELLKFPFNFGYKQPEKVSGSINGSHLSLKPRATFQQPCDQGGNDPDKTTLFFMAF